MMLVKLFPTKCNELRNSSIGKRKISDNLYFGLIDATSLTWDTELSVAASLVVPILLSHEWEPLPGGTDVTGTFGDKVLARPFDSSDKTGGITHAHTSYICQAKMSEEDN